MGIAHQGFNFCPVYVRMNRSKYDVCRIHARRQERNFMAAVNKVSKEDARLFYDIAFPLLIWQNKTTNVNPYFEEDIKDEMISPADTRALFDQIFESPDRISLYLKEKGSELPQEHTEILESWKNFRKGHFIVERYLKSGAVFLDETNSAYLVKGLYSSIEDCLHQAPALVETTLLPFKGEIITTGLLFMMPMTFGPGMKRSFRESYNEAKQEGNFFKEMPGLSR